MIDWASTAQGATVAVTTSANLRETNDSKCIDGDDATSAYGYVFASPPYTGTIEYVVTFPHTVTINSFRILCKATSLSPGTQKPDCDWSYYNGAWVLLSAINGDGELHDLTVSSAVGIPNVTKVKAYWHEYSSANGVGYSFLYTLSALGNYFIDKGLRIEQTAADTRSIAVETLDETQHKLRVRINGVTYGVPMVATTHTQASALRIYDGTSVKALVDIT